MLVNVGEVTFRLFRILMGDIEVDVIVASQFHLTVDRPGHDVARRQRETRVILLHELLASEVLQDSSVATHRLGDQEAGTVARMIEGCRVELDEFHVLHLSLGAIDHRDTVARSDKRVGGIAVDRLATAGSHDRYLREEGIHLAGLLVQHVGAETLDAGRVAGDDDTQMMLRDDLDGKMVLEDGDVRMLLHGADQAGLDLGARIVFMVQDTELRVAAFLVEVEFAVRLLVEVNTPFDQLLDLRGSLTDNLLDGGPVADPVARDHGILNMFLEIIDG